MVVQECPLGAHHQEAHDVMADAGEPLHLELDEVSCRDAFEALSKRSCRASPWVCRGPVLGGGIYKDKLTAI